MSENLDGEKRAPNWSNDGMDSVPDRINPGNSSFLRHSTFVISYCAVLDIRIVREQPDFVKSRLALRCSGDEAKIDELLRVDTERRKAETALQGLNAERKKLSKQIGGMRSRGQDSLALEKRVRKIGEEIARLNEDANQVDEQQKEILLENPNLPHSKVPIGKDASANPV